MVSNLRGRTYEDRLAEVGMASLQDRSVRRDIIVTYKIIGENKLDPRMFFDLVAEGLALEQLG